MNTQLSLLNQGITHACGSSVQDLGRKSNSVRELKTVTVGHDSSTDLSVDKPYRNGNGDLLPWEDASYGNS